MVLPLKMVRWQPILNIQLQSQKTGVKYLQKNHEKEGEDKEKVLELQIKEGLKEVSEKDLNNVVIAYEPVWAIGNGKNCSVKETLNSTLFIKKIITDLYSKEIANELIILYGGTVNR